MDQQRRQLARRGDVIGADEVEGALRQTGEQGVGGILKHHQPAGGAHGKQSRDSVQQDAGEQDADDPRPIGAGRRAKERVDGGTKEVLARPALHANRPVLQDQVAVRRRDVDVSGIGRLAVAGMHGQERSPPAEDGRQVAARRRGKMTDDKHRGRQPRRQSAHQLREGLNPPGGCTDHDDVARCQHGPLLCPQ